MVKTAVASFALFATSAVAGSWGFDATDVGSAIVVNKCNYTIKLCNVPSEHGGHEQEDTTLAAGESWSQKYTSLSNGNGWSIKLSKTDNLDSVLQYEYTFHDDGIIWYDLSCIDGNPWDKDWEITANGTDCKPKQQAYRYSTDDAYGMQSCSQDTAITVTVCTGTSQDNGSAVDGPSSEPPAPAPPAPEPAPAPSSTSTTSTSATPTSATPTSATSVASETTTCTTTTTTPTTFTTSTTSATAVEIPGVTITEIVTVYATAEVTAYAHRHKRHEHAHAGHNHA